MMAYGAQMMIAWEFFKDWWKTTFGGGIVFPTEPFQPLVPGYAIPSYQK